MMYQFTRLILLTLLLQTGVFATQLTGKWVLTTLETKQGSEDTFVETEFRSDKNFFVDSMKLGVYIYDQKSDTLTISSKEKLFAGEFVFDTFDTNKMVITKKTPELLKITFSKIDKQTLLNNNKNSHLEGQWYISSQGDDQTFVSFQLPNHFTYSLHNKDSSTTLKGTWFYDPKKKSLTVTGVKNPLSGTHLLEKKGDGYLVGTTMLSKTKTSDIERLDFSIKDLKSEKKVPQKWHNFKEMHKYLQNIDFVDYRVGNYLFDKKQMRYTYYRSKIQTTSKPSVMFNNITLENGAQKEQFSQKYKNKLTQRSNDFFPQDDYYNYRVVKKEKVQVPAGEFLCSVIEVQKGNTKRKLWMIDDKPGLYAKIISEAKGHFGKLEYTLQELYKIEEKK